MEVYRIEQLIVGANATNCWIVVYQPVARVGFCPTLCRKNHDKWAAYGNGSATDSSRLCALIDPGAEPDRIIAQLTMLALRPSHILLTHGHFDHILALPDLHSVYPEASIAIHRDDMPYLGPNPPRLRGHNLGIDRALPWEGIRELEDEDRIGPFRVLSTPGHTPGSVVFLLEEQRIMFSGDTLFKGDCGRVDLPGGDQGKIEQSLTRLLALDGDIHVLPGHGASTTIAAERDSLSRL
ncbi:MAG: MBL fold metallo-hydrolase [Treponema sp.]|jgi:glyoxylase-like metal-dependent hydrolase (beta-lactamase superfamily II)|nr:MBL fold metallo-hydrolase [Treponema sp.]